MDQLERLETHACDTRQWKPESTSNKKSVNARNAEAKHTLVFVDHTVRQNKIIIENNLEHILR